VISQETPNTRYIHRIHDDALETMGKWTWCIRGILKITWREDLRYM
jgi:hypothetical protein